MKFRSLREFADVSPKWVQPDVIHRRYELRASDAVLATLHWENPWGSLATGVTSEGRWTLKRAGFLRPRVTVRVAGSDADAAIVTLHWGGTGDVRLADGHEFRWTHISFWHSEWAFTSTSGEPLLVFKPNFALMRMEAEIEIRGQSLSLPELSLLALLGWYLMILIHEETTAAGIP
jgi:hypothetical protein